MALFILYTAQIDFEHTKTSQIRALLRGNFSEAIRGFKQKMKLAADVLDYEEAQKQKNKIDILTNYQLQLNIPTIFSFSS